MRLVVKVGGVVLFLVAFWIWYSVASNYDYGALAGTYVFRVDGESCTLYLRADQAFIEDLNHSGSTQEAKGHWHRYGEAHVSFSSEFLKVSNEELNESGQAHGEFDKTLGIIPKLVLAPIPGGPTFHKRWLN